MIHDDPGSNLVELEKAVRELRKHLANMRDVNLEAVNRLALRASDACWEIHAWASQSSEVQDDKNWKEGLFNDLRKIVFGDKR